MEKILVTQKGTYCAHPEDVAHGILAQLAIAGVIRFDFAEKECGTWDYDISMTVHVPEEKRETAEQYVKEMSRNEYLKLS